MPCTRGSQSLSLGVSNSEQRRFCESGIFCFFASRSQTLPLVLVLARAHKGFENGNWSRDFRLSARFLLSSLSDAQRMCLFASGHHRNLGGYIRWVGPLQSGRLRIRIPGNWKASRTLLSPILFLLAGLALVSGQTSPPAPAKSSGRLLATIPALDRQTFHWEVRQSRICPGAE
jgi:hypothetical protein